MTAPLEDQHERTLLAWRRTALSLVATGLLVGHLAVADAGRSPLVVLLVGLAAVVAFVWLDNARRVAVNGLALVAAVTLMGTLALLGISSG